jgi:hypothetical protein
MKPAVTLALPLLFATACYGAAPPKPPRIPLPPVSDDAELVVSSETKTEIEDVSRQSSTCPAGHAEGSPQCTIHRYTVAEPVTRTRTQATYAGEPITYGQFRVLTDADYDRKLSRLDELSHGCQRANIPRYIGIGLLVGGLIAIPASKGNDIVLASGYAALAGGGLSYGLGYFSFGGRKCNEARRLYTELDMSEEATWESVQGRDFATEMATLAEQFNARSRPASAMRMR